MKEISGRQRHSNPLSSAGVTNGAIRIARFDGRPSNTRRRSRMDAGTGNAETRQTTGSHPAAFTPQGQAKARAGEQGHGNPVCLTGEKIGKQLPGFSHPKPAPGRAITYVCPQCNANPRQSPGSRPPPFPRRVPKMNKRVGKATATPFASSPMKNWKNNSPGSSHPKSAPGRSPHLRRLPRNAKPLPTPGKRPTALTPQGPTEAHAGGQGNSTLPVFHSERGL